MFIVKRITSSRKLRRSGIYSFDDSFELAMNQLLLVTPTELVF